MNQQESKKFDRRTFLKILAALVTTIPFFLVIPLIKKRKTFMIKKREVTIPLDVQEGITFFPDCIVNRAGERISVFSSRCSHLGCRIDRQMGSELVCPCHGSRYSIEGKILTGPATRDLETLVHRVDEKENKIRVIIPV